MNTYDEKRPDPDELLASIKQQEEKNNQGKLKIFFGMCAGVGKTYTMLQSAHLEKKKQVDIVVGYVETHKRAETEKLVEGLEVIPPYIIEYKETEFKEVDIDAIIARKPEVVLIDELAHTNAPGSRHAKRYQDVQELLHNGINVYTTLNVQHIESRTDTVTQITGVPVRETVPDEVLEATDEIELVDITADELLQRFAEGKVYTPDRSQEAVRNFFRKGNITALREMSLRLVADRVDKQLRQYMQNRRIPGPWKSGIRLMVAIGPSPNSAWLIRWAKSLSYTMDATITAVYVQKAKPLSESDQEQLNKNIALAKQMGAHYFSTSGEDLPKAILEVAQRENITHIIVGKSQHEDFVSYFKRSLVSKLIHDSGDIDIYVVGAQNASNPVKKRWINPGAFRSGPKNYLISSLFILFVVMICYFFKGLLEYHVVSYILLFAVSLVALFYSMGPILLAATLSALLWDYFFINPPLTFYIAKPEDVMMMGTFFSVSIINGVLTARLKSQQRLAKDREQRAGALYELSKVLSSASGIWEVIEQGTSFIRKYFQIDSAVLLREDDNTLQSTSYPVSQNLILRPSEKSIAAWVYKHAQRAGKFTTTLPATDFTFYPLNGRRLNTGVLLIKSRTKFSGEMDLFWDTLCVQFTNALERELLNEVTHRASVIHESEKLYKTLFNSISHELRTPVSTLMGSSETLLRSDVEPSLQHQLAKNIFDAAERLDRLIENLLNMSRLESDTIKPFMDWHDVHDLVNKVLANLHDDLAPFNVEVVIPADMPLVRFDFGLMEQVLHNLVYNATQHANPHTTIRVKMYYDQPNLVLQVMDRGTGFPPESIPYLCNKFYRADSRISGGVGLGLSIVKGFVDAHQGTVLFENRARGGALITIKIPTEKYNLTEE
ncbi:sensor histidine kinase [Microbacter margulisiae]|uniref:histidine kinase n=1 Tax=Microbacter margulisiae TaxID=1350067 RepID=A0A7W5H101_9PORP|nr:sensor histidine kinase KdpD [Microbacter margulisiae]MBB3186124.1 two-component system sensor histidine kinase KdpD [Microbacter margulisiae]